MQTFGEFIREKRLSLGMEEHEFAKLVGTASSRIRSIEKNYPLQPHKKPNQSMLMNIAEALRLNEDGNEKEREKYFELSEIYKGNVPQILTPLLDYFHANEIIREAVKEAIENGATEADWKAFSQQIINRNIRSQSERNNR